MRAHACACTRECERTLKTWTVAWPLCTQEVTSQSSADVYRSDGVTPRGLRHLCPGLGKEAGEKAGWGSGYYYCRLG